MKVVALVVAVVLGIALFYTGMSAKGTPGGTANAAPLSEAEQAASKKKWLNDLEKAQAEAKSSGKMVLVDFTASWCPPCQMYKQDVFPTADFQEATKDVVLVEVDVDKQPQLANKYGIRSIPDIRLLSPTGDELDRVVGYEGEALISRITEAKAKIGT